MRIVEIVSYPMYIGVILMALDALSLILVRENTEDPTADTPAIDLSELEGTDLKKSTIYLADKCPRSDFHSFNGTVMEWFMIEVAIYIFFLIAMFLLMIKARFITIWYDNSDQFEPLRLSFIANSINDTLRKYQPPHGA
jgi:hypothetical protein